AGYVHVAWADAAGDGAYNLAIAKYWRTGITDGGTDLIEFDLIVLHQGHTAGSACSNAALAHNITWLHIAANTMRGHTVIGIGDCCIRAKFNHGEIQRCIFRYHGAGGANLPRISRGNRIADFSAVSRGHADLAAFGIGASHRQRAHGLIIDVDRSAWTIQ